MMTGPLSPVGVVPGFAQVKGNLTFFQNVFVEICFVFGVLHLLRFRWLVSDFGVWVRMYSARYLGVHQGEDVCRLPITGLDLTVFDGTPIVVDGELLKIHRVRVRVLPQIARVFSHLK
jgi:hypothetical protein